MNGDELQELYNTLRGSRSAMAVLDARTLFLERKMSQAYAKLSEAHASYQESRTRLLRQDPKKQFAGDKDAAAQIRRLERKQKKTREILAVFDDLLTQLERRAEREKEINETAALRNRNAQNVDPASDSVSVAKRPAAAEQPEQDREGEQGTKSEQETESLAIDEHDPITMRIARPNQVASEFLEAFQTSSGDEQLDLIGANFDFSPVDSANEVRCDALYFIRDSAKSYLVSTPPSLGDDDDTMTLTDLVRQKTMMPLSIDAFLRLGTQKKMVLLLKKATLPVPSSDGMASEQNDGLSPVAEPHVLDLGAFSQLMDSAQRSGLVPASEQIGHVRDREFRKGEYNLALLAIEKLYAQFTAAAAARTQRVNREEADIASGRVQMSPKELLAKRARDRAQEQAVERARNRFHVVLDGLRVLLKTT